MSADPRVDYLAEFGIQLWVPNSVQTDTAEVLDTAQPVLEAAAQQETDGPVEPESLQAVDSGSSPSGNPDVDVLPAAENSAIANMDWSQLRDCVSTCQNCTLHAGRSQTVFGVGNPQADVMIIGEAPGAEEDRRGEPFVGRAGQLLDQMIQALGMRREQVFIANILKCRPPGNRDPQADEVAACSAYLAQQVELVQPKLLLAVGRIAAQSLVGEQAPLGRLRGRQYQYADTEIPLLITYHPAYLLRSPIEKRKSWQDLKAVKQLLAQFEDG